MISDFVLKMEQANWKERSSIVNEMRRMHGWSRDKVYRELHKSGWDSGRRKRQDAGLTCVSDDYLDMLAAKLKTGIRKDERHVTDIPTARWMLERNGIHFHVSNARLACLLRERGLDVRSLKRNKPHVKMRSLYPNHVHQVDPSLCLVYYLPGGDQQIIKVEEAYKNKPFMKDKEHLKVWRYVLVDHYSASICVRYYQAAGESAHTLWDFLLHAWGVKSQSDYLFHGVPDILYWDKGSANMSGGIRNALRALGVSEYSHMPGRPRAKGQVENANHIVETHFECHLKEDPAGSVEELNAWVDHWCGAWNADALEGYDARLRRAGRSRLELWRTIGSERLRELPDEARELLSSDPVIRKVGGDLEVSYAHPRLGVSRMYRVGGLPGIRAGMSVRIAPMLMDSVGAVRVLWSWEGEDFEEHVMPVSVDEVSGFELDAPVWGESFRSHAGDGVDIRLDEVIGDEKRPFGHWNGGSGVRSASDAGSDSADSKVRNLPLTGEQIKSGPPEVRMNFVEAAGRLRRRLACWDSAYLDMIRERCPDGVSEFELDELEEYLKLGGRDGFEERIG